jgi:hypothetical protein
MAQSVDCLFNGQAKVDHSQIVGTLLPPWLAQPTNAACS